MGIFQEHNLQLYNTTKYSVLISIATIIRSSIIMQKDYEITKRQMCY